MHADNFNHEISSGSSWTIQSMNGSHDFKFGGYSLAKGMEAGKYKASDTFMAGGYKWRIRFYPNGTKSDGNSVWVSLFIALVRDTSDVRALFELTLLDQSGKGKDKVVSTCGRPYTLKCRGSMWGDERFFRRASLETSDYLKDDCLLVHCTVGVVTHLSLSIPPSDMGQKLKHLLETETCCDIALRVGDETFKAHKAILAAGSPVFRALFFGLLGNPNTNEVELKEVQPSIFKAMLLFIYSDTLPDLQQLTGSITEQLLAAADWFGVDRLKHLCEAKLGDEINVDTVATTLTFADKHYCSQLKFICLEFASQKLKVVMETEGFKYLEEACPWLLSELLQITESKAADPSGF